MKRDRLLGDEAYPKDWASGSDGDGVVGRDMARLGR